MNKHLIAKVLIMFFCATSVMAQENQIISQYSRFGLGQILPVGFGQSRAMGGTVYGMRSDEHLYTANPASITAIQNRAFIYNFGFYTQTTIFEGAGDQSTNTHSNMAFLSAGIPLTKWLKSGITLRPFSRMGYYYKFNELTENDIRAEHEYPGSGGLNQLDIALGADLTEEISLGVKGRYLFGSFNEKSIINLKYYHPVTLTYQRESQISDWAFDFGVQYHLDSLDNGKYFLNAGLWYAPGRELKGEIFEQTIKDIQISNIFRDRDTLPSNENATKALPQSFGLGLSAGLPDKLILAADYRYMMWDGAFGTTQNVSLQNSNRISLGAEYIPDKFSIRSYFSQVRLRTGFNWEDSYIVLQGEPVQKIGINFGLGFPLKQYKSSLNISFEYGQQSSAGIAAVQEEYFMTTINLSLFDGSWFKQYKYQ